MSDETRTIAEKREELFVVNFPILIL